MQGRSAEAPAEPSIKLLYLHRVEKAWEGLTPLVSRAKSAESSADIREQWRTLLYESHGTWETTSCTALRTSTLVLGCINLDMGPNSI